jgi:superfamily II DNA or RNA helicase
MDIPKTSLTKTDIDKIHKDLSVLVENDYGPPKKYKIFSETGDTYNVPLVWAVDNLSNITPPVFKEQEHVVVGKVLAKPRKEQKECIEMCKKEFLKDFGGGIINISTGGGKTLCSLFLIEEVKLKTLVVVNTVELMQQWKSAINKFLPSVSVGKIQGSLFDVEGKQVVIAMLHTLSMKSTLTKEMFKPFGVVIIDEVHHLSAEIFNKALLKIRTKYMFGLSATVERKDSLEYIFMYHIGKVLYSNVNGSLKQPTEFKVIWYKPENYKEEFMYNGLPKLAALITNLAEDLDRTRIICDALRDLGSERNVLVLSDRISQLKAIHTTLGDGVCGIFIGKLTLKQKEESKTKRILLATYSIANEGFDHPKLNTLLFATPRSSVVQSIGRIYRKMHEITPMIIDIVDQISVFPYQYKKRKKIYQQNISSKELDEEACLFD